MNEFDTKEEKHTQKEEEEEEDQCSIFENENKFFNEINLIWLMNHKRAHTKRQGIDLLYLLSQ